MGFPGSSDGKESACNEGVPGSIPGSGRSLGGWMATHPSIFAWKTPWTEKPGRYSPWGCKRVKHIWATKQQATVRGVPKELDKSEHISTRNIHTHMYLCTQVKQEWVYTKKQNGHKECVNSTLTNLILPNSFSERLYQYLFDQKYKESLMLSNFYTFTNLGAIKM